jgi:hypothetical protein
MVGHKWKATGGQQSNVLLLSAIVAASPGIVSGVNADHTHKPSPQSYTTPSTPDSSRHPKSKSRLPAWAYDRSPAGLDRNLHQDKFAQLLGIEHVPPKASLPNGRESEIIDDDDDERGKTQPTDVEYQPISTEWLLRGYSRPADQPTGLATKYPKWRCRVKYWNDHCTMYRPEFEDQGLIKPCDTMRGEADWMLRPEVQVLGALTLFLMIVMIMEGVRYTWHTCGHRTSTRSSKGQVALEGDEKQLRAYLEASSHSPVSSTEKSPV